jgi:magnesium and cobalt transporter
MAAESEKPSNKPSLLERLSHFLLREPEDREQLVTLLHGAYENSLMDADSLAMIEGVLQVSEMQVRDIMIPRSQMDVIDITDLPETFIPHVIETAHSRFPVIEDDKNDVIGILLAKDLLRYYAGEDFEVRDMLRPAVFIPESKRLNILLKEFRSNRNHIAIVVDEYGGVAGMVTIEDVLEQIVGDIEDEYDYNEDEDNIIQNADGQYRVKALTE